MPGPYFNQTYTEWLNQSIASMTLHPITPTQGQTQPMPSPLDPASINQMLGASPSPPTPKSRKKKNGNKLYNLPLIEAFKYQLAGKKIEGEVGLEIECEGKNLFDAPIQYWNVHQDGSLRQVEGHPPIEYTLRKPLPRDDIPKALTYLSKKLKEHGSSVVDSTRTSVHVHLNCQELTVKQIYQIWCLYAIFEEILIDFSGPERKGNLFCLSGKQAEYNVYLLETSIQTENFNELFSENLRYTSCNWASLSKFGSLEFRSMRGTVDQKLIQTWVDILLTIKDQALKYDNPREIVKDFQEHGPQRFIYKIFRDRSDIQQLFYSRPDYHTSMWDGARMMRDVAYAVKWQRYDPSLEKKDENQSLNDVILHPSIDNNRVALDTLLINPGENISWAVKARDLNSGVIRNIWVTHYVGMPHNHACLENYMEDMRVVIRFGQIHTSSWSIGSRRRYTVNLDTFRYVDGSQGHIEEDVVPPDQL